MAHPDSVHTPLQDQINATAGKALLVAALHGETTPRPAWVPFVGCHAGSLIQVTARDYLRSASLMIRGTEAALERYQPDGLPVVFDLQLEAEQLGCELRWADDNPPSVVSHPLSNGSQLHELQVPALDAGRVSAVLEATRQLCQHHTDTAFYGLVTGPFTLALHLLGTDIFMRMFDAPQDVHHLMDFARQVAVRMSLLYLEAGCDVIAVVDPMTSQIGPDQFREFVTPHVAPLFAQIREQNALTSFFVCGHAIKNIEAMCECQPHNVSVDENIPLSYVRDKCRGRGISFGGNLQLTSVLLLGTPEDAERNALECMEIGKNQGFILSPGCDLPYATPPANLEAIGCFIRDPYRQEVIRTMAVQDKAENALDLSDYGHSDRIVVDIITLDSEACTPCQYMVEAVKRVAPEFDGIVHWREHKIKYREELVFMTSLFVKNVPTICIDGQITFVSRIPPEEELIQAIQQRINEKIRDRIRRRRASVFVLGKPGSARDELLAQLQRAVTELGTEISISVLEKDQEFLEFGVLPSQTPALVIARYQLKSTRRVPELPVLKEWMKELT